MCVRTAAPARSLPSVAPLLLVLLSLCVAPQLVLSAQPEAISQSQPDDSSPGAGDLAHFVCAGSLAAPSGWAATRPARPVKGTDHPLVIFAAFRGSVPAGSSAPDYAGFLMDPEVEGSFAHFYREMSFGALTIDGSCLPKVYISRYSVTEARAGGYGAFNEEILQQVDAEIDLTRYDNDGPDRIPNTKDDDGRVDFVFVNILGDIPYDFIKASATGIASLGLANPYFTNDSGANRKPVSVYDGTTQRVFGFGHAVGSMAHEYGHTLGLPDLYSTVFLNDPALPPENDSAGIGAWGLMGMGAQGWNGDDGPNPFSAWEREQLGWIGKENDRVIVLSGRGTGTEIDDVETGGAVLKIPMNYDEYYLVENRQASGGFYDRHVPANGLLIWHVNRYGSQNDESRKTVDLECADGLYADAGYPHGLQQDPVAGKDNLDYWAHDSAYSRSHGGNTGDATDVFDGRRYTSFGAMTNPSTNAYGVGTPGPYGATLQRLSTGIALSNIRSRGTTMVLDFGIGYWSGSIAADLVWQSTVHLSGDVTIEAGATLTVLPGALVVADTTDDQHGGVHPALVELIVRGSLRSPAAQLMPVPVLFSCQGIWGGIRVLGPGGDLGLDALRIENAATAVGGAGKSRIRLTNFTISGNRGNGIDLTGMDGKLDLQAGVVEMNLGSGIQVGGTGVGSASRLIVKGNGRAGIAADGIRLSIDQSVVTENGEHGILVQGGTLEVTDSEVSRNGAGGIVAEGTDVVCTGSRLGGSPTEDDRFAVELNQPAGATIRGNRFELAGGNGLRVAGSLLGAEVQVPDNLFAGGNVGFSGLSTDARLSGNTFINNRTAVQCEGAVVPTLAFNSFDGNLVGILNATSMTVVADNNWWGSDRTAAIAGQILGPVIWVPFLIAAPNDQLAILIGTPYPNPLRGRLTIPYQVSSSRPIEVGLSLLDTAGQLVRNLNHGTVPPGRNDAVWDGRDRRGREVASGVYLLRIVARSAYRLEDDRTIRITVLR